MTTETAIQKDTMTVAAILSTLASTTRPGQPAPASSIYLALGCDLSEYERLTTILARVGAILKTGSTIVLTAAGRTLGTRVNEAFAR